MDDLEGGVPLMRLRDKGELLAECRIIIHDQAKAWPVFQAVFGAMAANIVGEFFETMRIACDQALIDGAKTTGFTIDLNPLPKPQIIVPQNNGHIPELRLS